MVLNSRVDSLPKLQLSLHSITQFQDPSIPNNYSLGFSHLPHLKKSAVPREQDVLRLNLVWRQRY